MMKLRYFGHSAFEITTEEVTLLLDPFLIDNPLAGAHVDVENLMPDYILVTHAHGDHWGDTMQVAQKSGAAIIGNFEITQYAIAHGHNRVVAMNTGGSFEFAGGMLTQTDARHSSSFPDGTYGGNPNGYLIRAEQRCVYALGDTAAFAEMQWIGDDNSIDVALVPIGDRFTMGPGASLRAIRMIRPALTIPVHYNTFPEIAVDVDEWKRYIEREGFETKILAPGEHCFV